MRLSDNGLDAQGVPPVPGAADCSPSNFGTKPTMLGLRPFDSRHVAPSCLRFRSRRNNWRRCNSISAQPSATRSRPDCNRNNKSSRLNSCWLMDSTAKMHLPGTPKPRRVSSLCGRGCHLYMTATSPDQICARCAHTRPLTRALYPRRWLRRVLAGLDEGQGCAEALVLHHLRLFTRCLLPNTA